MEFQPASDLWSILSHSANAGVLALIAFGLYHRHRQRIHIPVMLTCMGIDLMNVLFIEFRRDAVGKAIATAGSSGEWILKFHILVSTLGLVGYVVAAITGFQLKKGSEKRRKVHRLNAAVFLLMRVLNFLTSYYV